MPSSARLAHLGCRHSGEIRALLRPSLEVRAQAGHQPLLEEVDDDRLDLALLGQLHAHGVVAAGPQHDPVGPARRQLPVDGGGSS